MINKQKIEIFKKYGGDIDGFSRFGKKREKDIFSDEEWSVIDNVLQDLKMIKNGLCSTDYKNKTERTLNQQFDKESIDLIKKYVD